MNKKTLSVVLATHNEEKNLFQCLNSIKEIADEIVIVDGESTDGTKNIAKQFNAKVIITTNKPNFHINKNLAIDNATKDWILQLDADEVVSTELANEISKTINLDSKINGYWLNRKNWFLKAFLTKGGQYPDSTLRLYRNGTGRLPEKDVHEQAKVLPPTSNLKNDLLHYRDMSFEKYLCGFNRYSSFMSTQLDQRGQKVTILNWFNYLMVKPLVIFISIYIRHRGYVDGVAGFIFAMFSGFMPAVAYIKLWQKKLEL